MCVNLLRRHKYNVQLEHRVCYIRVWKGWGHDVCTCPASKHEMLQCFKYVTIFFVLFNKCWKLLRISYISNRWKNECGVLVEWYWQENISSQRKTCSVPNLVQENVNFNSVLYVITKYKWVSAVKSGTVKESIEMLGTLRLTYTFLTVA